MSGFLPLVRGNATALYPVTRKVCFQTNVAMATNATEQRWKQRQPYSELTLPYTNINAADLATMRAFVESQKGAYDSTWQMVLGRQAGDGQIANGSNSLLCLTSEPFLPNVTGQTVVVPGAGVGGAPLITTITYFGPTQVATAVAASTTVTNADTRWGYYFGGLALIDNQITATEEDQTRTNVSFTLRARQTLNPSPTAGSSGGTFPTLANGTTTQFPYVRTQRYQVTLNQSPSGIQYAWTWFGGGLTGFPTGSLRGWELHGSMLSDADLATWETFFRNQWGRFGGFSFTDPDDSTVHTKCRFADDSFEVTHQQPNISSVVVRIVETN
jgi:hypothetical protein